MPAETALWIQLERHHHESVLVNCKPPSARPAARLRRRCSGSCEADGVKYVVYCWPQDLVYLLRRDQCKGPGRLTFHDRRSLAIVCQGPKLGVTSVRSDDR